MATRRRWCLSTFILVLLLLQSTTGFSPSGRTTTTNGSNSKSISSDSLNNNRLLPRPDRFELAQSAAQERMASSTSKAAIALPVTDTDMNKLEIPKPPSMANDLPLIQLALAGSIATFFADLSIHPIDCIKTIQQSDQGHNLNMLQAARYLYKQDGIHSFFHGFFTYAIADAGAGALKFGVWETWKRQWNDVTQGEPPVWFVATGAALAFLVSSVVIVPGEFLKQQLQVSYYSGFWEAVQGVAFSEDGSFHVSGLFTGYDGVLFRDIPYTVLELGMYDNFKRTMDRVKKPTDVDKNKQDIFVLDQLLCAAATGVVAAFATTPMDVIKTKLMVDDYSSFLECLMITVKNNGPEVLYSGMVARIAWIVPFTVLYLPVYDMLKRLLWGRHVDHLEKNSPPY
ncbi:hypothetical protein ACA910_006295 [Epithemia clementina (nom. ined.)]